MKIAAGCMIANTAVGSQPQIRLRIMQHWYQRQFERAKWVVAMLLVLGAAFLIASCKNKDAPAAAQEQTHIVTTVECLADLAKKVGGDRVSVDWFVEAG